MATLLQCHVISFKERMVLFTFSMAMLLALFHFVIHFKGNNRKNFNELLKLEPPFLWCHWFPVLDMASYYLKLDSVREIGSRGILEYVYGGRTAVQNLKARSRNSKKNTRNTGGGGSGVQSLH